MLKGRYSLHIFVVDFDKQVNSIISNVPSGLQILVLLTCTTKQASAACQLSVYKCVIPVPSLGSRLGCLAPYEIKKGPLIFDCTIKPTTAINLDRFQCNHGKNKLAVLFYQSENDVGGPVHKEMVFKEHCTGGDVARLDALLCQGPYRDMHPFEVDIAPHQSIPEGPARLAIFPTHISVVKRYKQERPKDNSRRGGQIATIKREMRPLPMVVRLKDLDNFSPLQLGFRFEVSQQSYFFGCNEGGEDMNNLVSSFRHTRRNSVIQRPDGKMTILPGSDPQQRRGRPSHRNLIRLNSAPTKGDKPPLQRQVSAPVIVALFEDEEKFSHCEDIPKPLDDPPPPPLGRPLPDLPALIPCAPELPPKVPRKNSESPPSTNDVGTANHYMNEWEARRCNEELHGGIKLNIGIFASKPQLGQTWIVYVTIYKQGVLLKEVKENFPAKVDIVCPPRAFQVAQHLSINAEVPEGWNTADVVKDIYMESLNDLGGWCIHEICIQHSDTEQKQFHGRIQVRQGLVDTLTLNIITNFSLYERVGRRGTDDPLYDLVPATEARQGFLQQFSRRKEFCDQMDQINIFGNDYRLLGEKIGLDYQALLAIDSRCSRSATGLSPTELVLREWERGGRTTVPFSQDALVTILHDMGRPDIIQDMGLQVPKLNGFRVAGTTENTIIVTWELDTQEVSECTIELKPSGGDSWTTVDCVQNNENNRTFQLEGLEAGTKYSIRIQPSFQRVQGEWMEVQARTDAALQEEEEEEQEDEDEPPDNEVQQDVEDE
ncbi:PREDICTED: uncharacterized protein LOC109482247 [Branchiostoma belcheri]|uniref:Uncharacterized protein LOC109482247 n=1 Tax=Branchiostoma belcheri TaxID=7741 RepID=A0A6P4ZUE0_BRABE|nr:PREDICTED: uncharacterized protein LOC109482247 [Branchiostoma belcheri]